MSPHCFAHKRLPDLLYTQIGPTATWRTRPRTTEQYFEERNGDIEALALIPGWHLSMHRGDPMHIIFLGVALHFLPCCIWELINTDVFGAGSIKVKLEKAWEHMKSWVRAHGLEGLPIPVHSGQFADPR